MRPRRASRARMGAALRFGPRCNSPAKVGARSLPHLIDKYRPGEELRCFASGPLPAVLVAALFRPSHSRLSSTARNRPPHSSLVVTQSLRSGLSRRLQHYRDGRPAPVFPLASEPPARGNWFPVLFLLANAAVSRNRPRYADMLKTCPPRWQGGVIDVWISSQPISSGTPASRACW